MSYIYTDALYSTPGGNGFYSLSSDNAEIVATNNNTFTAAYNVCGDAYNQADITSTTPLSASVVRPAAAGYTVTIAKYNNGVVVSPNGTTTFTFTISSTAAIPMALLLVPTNSPYPSTSRSTLAVPFSIPAGTLSATTISVDLSAASTDYSDPERRRLYNLGYIG